MKLAIYTENIFFRVFVLEDVGVCIIPVRLTMLTVYPETYEQFH